MSASTTLEDNAEFLATVHHDAQVAFVQDAVCAERKLHLLQPCAAPSGSYVRARVVSLAAMTAELVELLAMPDTATWELYGLFASQGLSPCFSASVQREVQRWLADPQTSDPELIDLESLPFVTVDGEHSKDLDQALFVQTQESGEFTVYYALADASHYVPVNSALFAEAMLRAASYYLPSVMVPMLPRELSEGLVSLNENVVRRSLVFQTQVRRDGSVVHTQVRRARIRSRAKLSFGQVQQFYDAPAHCAIADPAVRASLTALQQFAQARLAQAAERNTVRYRRTEIETTLPDASTRAFVVTEAIRHPVEAYNEQLSLLCNAEGARLLNEASRDPLIEPIFRVHPAPEPSRLEQFRHLVAQLARVHQLSDDWTWHREQSLADYLSGLPNTQATDSIAAAIHRQAVMLNVGSSFSAQAASHYGVGADVYARFSAPMREIVGVFLHRELIQVLSHRSLDDAALRCRVVERANHAKMLQKRLTNEANLLVLDQIFSTFLGSECTVPATLVGLTSTKAYVILDTPPIDAKVHLRDVRSARNDRAIHVDDAQCQLLTGNDECLARVGDRVQLTVLSHDLERKHWVLSLAAPPSPLP